MVKINKKDNVLLFKKKGLIAEMRGKGITRVSPEALLLLEDCFRKDLGHIFEGLREEMITNGRKTLKKEDVQKVFWRIKKEEEAWDV